MPQNWTSQMRPMCVLAHVWEGANSVWKALFTQSACFLFVLWSAGHIATRLLSGVSPMISALACKAHPVCTRDRNSVSTSLRLSLYRMRSAHGDSVCHLFLAVLEYWVNCQLQTHLRKTWANHSPQSDTQSLLFRARSFSCYNVQQW